MRKRTLWQGLLAILISVLVVIALRPDFSPRTRVRPKLLVVIVIDQLRYDYLERYRERFDPQGLGRLLEEGAHFVNCRFDYASTETGPGHASLLTGAYGNMHGIIANHWYDRKERRPVGCVEDPELQEGKKVISPRRLLGTTLGDELRLATEFQAKVISISLKDRAAVLMGGHTANGAYWLDRQTGDFVSSGYYAANLPSWAQEFNRRAPFSNYCGQKWSALDDASKVLQEFKSAPETPCPSPQFLSWVVRTPFANEVELEFAWEAVLSEKLGQRGTTDLLAISLSANDYLGHEAGPYSPTVQDATLRTDRFLAGFFMKLDRQIGRNNYWIALSTDHGVAPSSRFVMEHRLGRGSIRTAEVLQAIEQTLTRQYGPGPWLLGEDSNLYLNLDRIKERRLDRAQVESQAAEAAMGVPGVVGVFTRSQILNGYDAASGLARKVAQSFHPQRSGDVIVVWEPYAIPSGDEDAAVHGSPWNYDGQVPLLFWGNPFRAGTYAIRCQPIDLAPTLAAALSLPQPSGAEGQILVEILK